MATQENIDSYDDADGEFVSESDFIEAPESDDEVIFSDPSLDEDEFDFMGYLSGLKVPSAEVPLILNERVVYELTKAREFIEKEKTILLKAEIAGAKQVAKEAKARIAKLEEVEENLSADVAAARFVFSIQALDSDARIEADRAAKESAEHLFVNKKGLSGKVQRVLPDANSLEYGILYQSAIWAAYTTKITAPDGKVQHSPSPESMKLFYNRVGDAQVQKFAKAVEELSVKAGDFESSISADFLAKP